MNWIDWTLIAIGGLCVAAFIWGIMAAPKVEDEDFHCDQCGSGHCKLWLYKCRYLCPKCWNKAVADDKAVKKS